MKEGVWIKSALWAAGGLLAVLVWVAWPSREIAYNGRSLSKWLDVVQSANAMERVEAAAAIRAIGTNAEPVLLDWLQRRDSSAAKWFSGFLAKHGAPLSDPNGYRASSWDRFSENYYRSKAILGFQVLGPMAYRSVPALQDLLTNAATRFDAAVAINAVASELTKPIMAQWSKSTNAALRVDALRMEQEILDQKTTRRAWDVP